MNNVVACGERETKRCSCSQLLILGVLRMKDALRIYRKYLFEENNINCIVLRQEYSLLFLFFFDVATFKVNTSALKVSEVFIYKVPETLAENKITYYCTLVWREE